MKLSSVFLIAAISISNGEMIPPVFEGDIKVFYPQVSSAYGNEFAENAKQNGMITDDRRRVVRLLTSNTWPSGIVPYAIDPEFFDDAGASKINSIMSALSKKLTPYVSFKLHDKETDYVIFRRIEGNGCWSYLGRIGGQQTITLGCVKDADDWTGVIEHEVMHTLGFWHEQSRSDRDEYVMVNFENIKDGAESQFAKRNDMFGSFGFPYDHASVVHYGGKTFSKNGKPTMESINPIGINLGNAKSATDIDIAKIRAMYGEKGGTLPPRTGIPTVSPTTLRPPCTKVKRRKQCNRLRHCYWNRKAKRCKFN